MSSKSLERYRYAWPYFRPADVPGWKLSESDHYVKNLMAGEELHIDSRWPAFFPSAISFVTAGDGRNTALEKVVGASIVNRFPYVIALSFCVNDLSERHYARSKFLEILESKGTAAIQFFEPGRDIDAVMSAINDVPDGRIEERIPKTGLSTRSASTSDAPVFNEAYMVYEARLVRSGKDFAGDVIFEKSNTEFGSHKIYFLEIQAIQLREDIARGTSQIHWHALPQWKPKRSGQTASSPIQLLPEDKYRKGYTPNYVFPSTNTIAFESDFTKHGMSVLRLPETAAGQVELDNDRARWPCFFPSSAGLITTWDSDRVPNLMPCGSTTVLIRNPLCIGIFVSYAEINERYGRRASLRSLDEKGRFACGVPFDNESLVAGIKYSGNISIDEDKDKLRNSGLSLIENDWAPIIAEVPITYLCDVVRTQRLGTHIMYLGEVKAILIRDDVTNENPLIWYPYADVQVAA